MGIHQRAIYREIWGCKVGKCFLKDPRGNKFWEVSAGPKRLLDC